MRGAWQPVHRLVEQWSVRSPESLAVHGLSRRITYAELEAEATSTAQALTRSGLGPGSIVAVLLPRDVDLVPAALGVLKSGAAYLPLDPANPAPRLAAMCDQAGVTHVVTDVGLADRVRAVSRTPVIPAPPARAGTAAPSRAPAGTAAPSAAPALAGHQVAVSGDDLGYVVFTSGSTGTPKGVMISHAAFRNMVDWHRQYPRLSPADRTTMTYSPGFDAGIAELWSALSAGATVYVPPREAGLAAAHFQRWLITHRITVAYASAALADALMRLDWPAQTTLRTLMTGDDRLAGRPSPGTPFSVVNNYGPTENSVVSTAGPVRPDGSGPPSIGMPVAGTRIQILDEQGRPAPEGELYVSGPGLAIGYLNDPDLTAARFVSDPTRPGERMYRTGDLVRRRDDGELDFLGRIDRQVKVRGYRIEPGEVESVLRTHPLIATAHVTTQPHPATGEPELTAYLVAADPQRVPGEQELREHAAVALPEYLRPGSYVLLDALPQTVSGKIDPTALPRPGLRVRPADSPYTAPSTPLQRRLVALWEDVLRVDRIGVDDHLFDLGGHSLLAAQLLGRVRAMTGLDVPIEEFFARPTVAALAHLLDTADTGSPTRTPGTDELAITPVGASRGPLSAIQEEAWFIEQLAPGNAAYHTPTTFRVRGAFDPALLAEAMTLLVRRHEALRTTFEQDEQGRAWQVVAPPYPVTVEMVDLSDLPDQERATRLAELVRAESRRPFDLRRLPLLRWTAVRLGPEEHELLLVEHHLVHDGWSFNLLLAELAEAYAAAQERRAAKLPDLTVQYLDFALWQRTALTGAWLEAQLAYWRRRLDNAPQLLELPTDRPRPNRQTFHGEQVRLDVPVGLSQALRRLAREAGATLFTTMYAGFTALMHRYTAATDVVIGSGFANRRQPEIAPLIGMIVNSVVLRTSVDPQLSFWELLRTANETVLGAADNQEYPFTELVRQLRPGRDPSYNPFFQVLFSFHDSPTRQLRFGESPVTVYEIANGTAKLDLNVVVIPRGDQQLGPTGLRDERITVLWEYNRDLFDPATAEQLATHYLRLLASLTEQPRRPLWQADFLSAQERTGLTALGRGPAAQPGPSVPERVLAQADRTPEAIAVAEPGRQLRYRDLVRSSERVAAGLADHGIGPGQVVGLHLPRGTDLVVAALGVLRAGAAYAPLDPVNPAARIAAMIHSGGITTVITAGSAELTGPAELAGSAGPAGSTGPAGSADQAGNWLEVRFDQLINPSREPVVARLDPRPGPDDPAYVIFTSGSTGEPKGVLVPHGALANLVNWYLRETGLTDADRGALVASPGFDATMMEIWPALSCGARIEAPTRETVLSPDDLARWLVDQAVSVAFAPTPLAEALLDQPWQPHDPLRVLVTGGDRLLRRPPVKAPFRLVNVYGPTENTVVSTATEVAPEGVGAPTIGGPIDGVTVHLLDGHRQPVPRGVVGELYLGGVNLAIGYVNQPQLTTERFVPDPFGDRPDARLYRSGDLARWNADGSLDFIGRTDHQMKIRGFRIEAGEVETALREHPAVVDACLVARGDGDRRRAVAYLVVAAGHDLPTPAQLRAHLRERLPGYMVPNEYLPLPAFPLNANGKIDRAALPDVPTDSTPRSTAPTRDLERWLVVCWQEVLDLPQVGIDDNFFDLGGHSLLVASVHRRLRDRIGRDLPIVLLFQYPTIRSLTDQLTGGGPPDRPTTTDTGTSRADRRRAGHDLLARRRAGTESPLDGAR